MKPFKILAAGFISLAIIFLLGFSPRAALADDNCSYETPTDAPNLYQVSYSSTSATLYFAQPSSTFTGYVISYGLTSSADAYSVSVNMGVLDGAVKYVVHDLFPKTNYFFKVRAVNNCSYGPWSQTLSTDIKGAGNLPETGPNNLLNFGILGVAIAILGVGLVFLL